MTTTVVDHPLTPKQESFARYLFQGLSQREAYLKAGYSSNQLPDTIDRAAYTLAASYKIHSRVKELQKLAEDATVASVLERKQVLSEITRARVGQFVDENGNLAVKREQLNNAAVQEVDTERTRTGGIRTKLKLRDLTGAIDLLNKMDGIYKQADTAVNITNDNRTVNIIVKTLEGKQVIEQLRSGKLPGTMARPEELEKSARVVEDNRAV